MMLFAFFPGPTELAVVGALAVMLFGKRLPEVARQVGRGWIEFKRGISGIQAELNAAIYDDNPGSRSSAPRSNEIIDYDEQTAPKFIPPPAEPPAS